MTRSTTPTEASDLHAAVIADAALRLAYLQRLADLGMRLAEEICDRAINSPYHPEPVHEPARAFATVSRAVRLTLVLQERMQAKLIALRNGKALSVDAPTSVRGTCERRTNASDAVRNAALDDEPEMSDRSRETLRDSESKSFEELVSGSFGDCVAVIRADLGLADEDLPFEEEGAEPARDGVRKRAAATVQPSVAPGPMASSTRSPQPPDSG